MGVTSLSNRDKEWTLSGVNDVLHFVLPQQNCCRPNLRFAVAVIEQKDLYLRIDYSLPVQDVRLNSLISGDDDPIVLAALPDPIGVLYALMGVVGIQFIDCLECESRLSEDSNQTFAASAIQEH